MKTAARDNIVAAQFCEGQQEVDQHVAILDRRIASLERRKARLQALAKLQDEVEKLEIKTLLHIPSAARASAAAVQIVCSYYTVKQEALLGPVRTQPLVFHRHVAMCLLREMSRLSLQAVADYFGRDHGSTLHACRNVHTRCEIDPQFSAEFHLLKDRFAAALQELSAHETNS
jgi:chromosomal replication initiation ATPase DnaA